MYKCIQEYYLRFYKSLQNADKNLIKRLLNAHTTDKAKKKIHT